eukprot:c26772_g1_i1 orf=205-4470(+)
MPAFVSAYYFPRHSSPPSLHFSKHFGIPENCGLCSIHCNENFVRSIVRCGTKCRFSRQVVTFASCGGGGGGGSLSKCDSGATMPFTNEPSTFCLSSPIDTQKFQVGLIPKQEIGAERFLLNYPHYDGRGIVIAIFDSGVDPAAAGLQITSDGKPKLLDVIDCTGSGDVDTSKIAKADDDGFIIGASGAKLQVNKSWKNPSGQWHVGCKLSYELFTETLVSRLKNERKKKWDEVHMRALTDALWLLAAFDQKHGKPSEVSLKKEREDLQNRVDLLQKLSETYEDKGPIIDAVVWNDGDNWRVALETLDFDDSGHGKLADFSPLASYRIEHQFGIFSKMDACSFVTNVYDDGNILSIVTDSSPHGTHVAAITAAYHPEEPLLCGVAPGAQLISCKIGDSRLGSMETGTGLTRALIAVVKHKCHLINMSYGEPTMLPDYGRFVEMANEVVNKHGVVFVSSAGNAGPSLNTVGAPGGTSSSIIGIGAYVSPAMSAAIHSVVEPLQDALLYTWSSRGPTSDGDLGVCLSAPGAAVAPVPQWTLQRRMLMNGTSMASPCACGGIALVLSALKAEGQPINPWFIRKSLENTAARVTYNPEESLTTGYGLLQVDKAYEYWQHCKDKASVWYDVQLNRSGNSGPTFRGVYLREASDCCRSSEWTVQVKPKFHEDADKIELVVPFEEHIQLAGYPSWVKTPYYMLLMHNGRTFNIVVDPTGLEPGVHSAEVYGIDCDAPWRGPLFRIPITVLKPMEILNQPPSISFSGLKFVPGHIERQFINVPVGSTWGEATLKLSGFDSPLKFFLNVVQVLPMRRPVVWDNFVTFSGSSSKTFAFPIHGGVTMELTLAQFWTSGIASYVQATAELEVEFHGLSGNQSKVVWNGSEGVARVDVKCHIGAERLAPRAVFTKIRSPYQPVDVKLEPLSVDRDQLPNGRRIVALTLTYKFTVAEAGKVTPRVPLLNKRIYDTAFESQFYMISDPNKRVLAMGDAYPKGIQLSKGDYTLKLFLRHDNIQYLEKLKKLVVFIDKNLEEKNHIHLSFYTSMDGVITGADSFKSSILVQGETQPFYIASPLEEKLPKDVSVGSLLIGKITYGRVLFGNKGKENGQPCPASYSLECVIPPSPKVEEKPKETNAAAARKSTSQIFEEQVRDAKIKALSTLQRGNKEEQEDWNNIAATLKSEYPGHLYLMSEILQKLASTPHAEDVKHGIERVIVAADEVIDIIDKDVLAKFCAMKSEAEDPDAMQVRKEMELQRDALADALYKKGLAIAQLEDENLLEIMSKEDEPQVPEWTQDISTANGSVSQPSQSDASTKDSNDDVQELAGVHNISISQEVETKDRFDGVYAELRKWVDITSTKYSLLTVIREKRCGRLGSAIKVLNELLQDDGKPPQKNLYKLRVKLIEQIGWPHWAAYEKKCIHIRFPSSLPPF